MRAVLRRVAAARAGALPGDDLHVVPDRRGARGCHVHPGTGRHSRSSERTCATNCTSTAHRIERYGEWVNGLAHGDLGCYYGTSGYSTASPCPDKVADRVKDALPISLVLMFYAQLLALVIAIPMGVLTAYRAGSVFDKTVNTTAFALLAIPNFVLALVLAYYVGTKLGWVEPDGLHRLRPGPGRVLPATPAAGHQPRGRTGRGLHAAAAQRHDRDAAGGLRHDGAGQGPEPDAHPVAPRAPAVEPHAVDRRRASTSARSSAARS